MHMQVQMPVDVREREPRVAKTVELGADLGAELRASAARELVPQSRPDRRLRKAAAPVHEGRNHGRGRGRGAGNEDEMQPHGEPGTGARDGDGFRRGLARHHEAGARQDAVIVRLEDRAVDAAGETEIVAVDDEPLQARSSRPVMNRRNSAPSRSRR